jgi:hypothetical protein
VYGARRRDFNYLSAESRSAVPHSCLWAGTLNFREDAHIGFEEGSITDQTNDVPDLGVDTLWIVPE